MLDLVEAADQGTITLRRYIAERDNDRFTRHLELDLQTESFTAPCHFLIESRFSTEDILAYADFYRSFWDGAPEARGVLLVIPGPENRNFSSIYGSSPPRWGGIEYTDADSAEIAYLYDALNDGMQFREGIPVPLNGNSQWSADQAQVFEELARQRRLIFVPSGHQDMRRSIAPPMDVGLIVPLGRYGGRLSDQAATGVVVNSGYFVWTEEEFVDDPTCRVPDPAGFVMENGHVLFPPVYSRPALLVDETGRLHCARLSMDDCLIELQSNVFEGRHAVTRATTVPPPGGPHENGLTRIVIVGTTVVGRVIDHETAVPPGNGFFLDVPNALVRDLSSSSTAVRYVMKDDSRLWSGSQGSILLIEDGVPLDLGSETAELQLTTTPAKIGGIAPNHLTAEVLLGDGRAQVAVGISADARVLLHHVEHTEPRSADSRYDSFGCPISAVRDRLYERGAVSAIALDGGGSALIAMEGKAIVSPADRFDIRHLPRERLVPGGWYFPQSKTS